MSELTTKEQEQKQSALTHPINVPPSFKGYLERFAALVATDFLVQEADGWRSSRFVTAEPVTTSEAISTSGSYVDLATEGPIIEGLADGDYLFIYGFYVTGGNSVNDYGSAVLDINGATQSEDFVAKSIHDSLPGEGGVWAVGQYGIANDNNNIVKLVYKAADTSHSFERRFLHAVKIHPIS